MNKHKVGVVGIGEVGSAISEVLSESYLVLKKDLDFDDIGEQPIDYLHICIPFNTNFLESAIEVIKKYSPKLTIIHSTVAVGTTRKVFKKTKLPIVHSPVRGTHPNLSSDIKKFVKYVGGVDGISTKMAVEHLKRADLKVEIMKGCEETELGKLFDTTYYAWNIIFCKLVDKLCQEQKLDFDDVYTRFNTTYNLGYLDTKPNVIRPILKNVPGPIGGHCLIENATILNEQFETELTNFLLKTNEKFKIKTGPKKN